MTNMIFVKMDKYEEISEKLNQIRGKLAEAREVLVRIQELKKEEDQEIASWQSDLSNIEHRINQINKVLTEEPET